MKKQILGLLLIVSTVFIGCIKEESKNIKIEVILSEIISSEKIFMVIANPESKKGLWMMNVDGSDRKRVIKEWTFGDCSLSPDGKRLIFSKPNKSEKNDILSSIENRDIYEIDIENHNLKRLTNMGGSAEQPCWSPDGRKIVFTFTYGKEEHYRKEIYTMDADGKNIKRLTNNSFDDDSPSWSPDGKRIVFMAGETILNHDDYEIYIINVNGNNIQRLTYNKVWDGIPIFSPDGKKIVFSQETIPPSYIEFAGLRWRKNQLVVMDLDGKSQTPVMSYENNIIGASTWLPDGKKIVFSTGFGGDIYIIDVERKEVINLTNTLDIHEECKFGWKPR